jgi:class 3 adenylate cyclase/predicted ATPase
MTFPELLVQVRELLQSKGRVSYRALKLQFNLDDEYLDGLKDELIEAERIAADEDGKVLVWVGAAPVSSSESRVPSSPQSLTPNPHSLAERRQLTVMFCDLVGSTALSTQLDPEELREVVRGYQETGAAVIERFGGHIAQYLGDGLLVYFGYPVAHEDDAQRAVRAGLEIVEAIRGQGSGIGGQEGLQSLSARLFHQLQVRIGVHTGPVVVGEMGGRAKREQLALGETPNLAARIQGQAAPNEVVISTATYRLVEGLFECEDRGQPELKGVATPLTLYRVVKEGEAQSRFQVVLRKGLTPLVGREHEYGLLRECWEQVKSGEGQVVLLSGEPGIGKSRLVEALKEYVKHEGASCLELRCSPYHQNSALYPVIEYLQRVLRFQSGDSSEEKLRKLVGAMHASPLQTETIPLLAALLSLPHPEGYPPITLSPQKQKEKTQEALVAWLGAEAKQQAVMYGWEDLHWADPSTLELITLFLAHVPTTHLFAVLTFRPEFTPPWDIHSYLSQLTLSRLGRTHVETMVEKVTGGKTLPQEIVQQIVSKTDGVPLFVEELTKAVLESVGSIESGEKHGQSSLQLRIPATLQDALMARLDRLGPAKEIAQLGATIGREFNYELLQAVSPLNEGALQQGLKQLVEAELVYQNGAPPHARYLFKHALVQDTAYQSLLKSRRQQLHQQVAQVLEERFPDTTETQPELLAHHYTEAGLIAQALPYWQKAGERAIERSAYVEAVNHLTRGLEVLKALPDTPERIRQELALQIALGGSLMATQGYASVEVEKVYSRALDLCRQVGETPQLFPVLKGLYLFYTVRGELQTTRELGGQLLRLAQSLQDPALLMDAYWSIGVTSSYFGEFASARAPLEQGIALYDPEQHRSHAFLYGQDPGMFCLSYAAWTLWFLGYPDQALKKSHEALVLARELSHPHSLAVVLNHVAWLHHHRREEHEGKEQAEAAIALSTEHGFAQRVAVGTMLRGWALVEQGQGKEGIAQIRQGLTAYRATGAELMRPYFLALLTEAYGKIGQAEEGLSMLAEALALAHKNWERWYEAELYRLKGTLTLEARGWRLDTSSSSPQASSLKPPVSGEALQEAEGYFLKAIEIAQKQQAKSLELRATTSLARLWQQQGKHHEAHSLLLEIYNWFTEGFDTKDLQEAKALLKELNH